MSAGLPAVTQPLTTSAFQRFFQEACVEKTGLSLETISHIFAYYNSKINKPTYAIQLQPTIDIPQTSKFSAFVCSALGGGAITYFHTLFDPPSFDTSSFLQHVLEVFVPNIAPPAFPYLGDPPPARKKEQDFSALLTQLASSEALIYADDVAFTASGTTLTRHTRAEALTATSAGVASPMQYPIASAQDRVHVMAYNPFTSTLMIGTTKGVVASRDFSQTSEWREFPRTPHSTPVHFLAPRGLGFIAVSPLSIREFGKRSIPKVIASASGIMQFRTAAYNPDQDTLGVVCRFEGFDTVREYSLETGACKGEMLFETQVIALCPFNEKWVIVTETSSENPVVKKQNILISDLSAGEILMESPLTAQWLYLPRQQQQLPPEASQVMHKQYLAISQAGTTGTTLTFLTASQFPQVGLPMASYSIVRGVPSTSSASSSGSAATIMEL
jgi:hypothetical protein